MITIIFDKNLMRAPAMEEFLAMDRSHSVAFSDWTIIEMQKKNALTTSRESLTIAAKFPNQVFALRPIGDILDDEVRSKDDAVKLIDYAESVRLGQLAADLRRVPPPEHLGPMMQEAETYASTMIERLRNEVADWEDALVGAAGEFTREERRAIATKQKVSDATKRKAVALLLEATRNFMIDNQQKQGEKALAVKDAMSMFAFRYSLCVLIHTLAWIGEGAGRGKKLERRVNDAIDLQVAAVGTYFEGAFSGDKQVRDVSFVARTLLRQWGAYVGDDWQHPDLVGRS
ncbi:MAG: hypothetical protein OSA41_04115 [Erythrobacter sp.]|uniref:hypothetical protein n=1 Tax=Qipengyuania citrea TaxID=225971 RepID=UPI001A4AD810|nr:hypothetical protein [Qipengyuania citrea]MBL4717441.1 hypothetical protein [Erythrobacter sp.]MCP2016785.1 hypothetical protein [Qipengyuania citrea]MDE0900884.1 hypothetical protein [Erythrobacter sp.]